MMKILKVIDARSDKVRVDGQVMLLSEYDPGEAKDRDDIDGVKEATSNARHYLGKMRSQINTISRSASAPVASKKSGKIPMQNKKSALKKLSKDLEQAAQIMSTTLQKINSIKY